MSGSYPSFKRSYSHDELVEHFLLTPADLELVLSCRGEANRCGMALLLKGLGYLGYVPEHLHHIPGEVRTFITRQLGLLWDFSNDYPWESRTRDTHLQLIRAHTGWRFPTAEDKTALEHWLRQSAAFEAPTVDRLLEYACQRLREFRITLPAEGELYRMVNAALSGFFHDIHQRITAALTREIRERMDALLLVPVAGGISKFDTLKADARQPRIDNLHTEIDKLRVIRAVGLVVSHTRFEGWRSTGYTLRGSTSRGG